MIRALSCSRMAVRIVAAACAAASRASEYLSGKTLRFTLPLHEELGIGQSSSLRAMKIFRRADLRRSWRLLFRLVDRFEVNWHSVLNAHEATHAAVTRELESSARRVGSLTQRDAL